VLIQGGTLGAAHLVQLMIGTIDARRQKFGRLLEVPQVTDPEAPATDLVLVTGTDTTSRGTDVLLPLATSSCVQGQYLCGGNVKATTRDRPLREVIQLGEQLLGVSTTPLPMTPAREWDADRDLAGRVAAETTA
jgi:hypothetical protein